MKSAAPRPSDRTVASSGGIDDIISTGRSREAMVALEPLQQLQAVGLGHHDVEQQQVVLVAPQPVEQVLAAGTVTTS